jgi:hypothetical protein
MSSPRSIWCHARLCHRNTNIIGTIKNGRIVIIGATAKMPAASLGPSSKRRTAILSDGSIASSSSVSKLTSPSLIERLKYSAGLTHDPDRDLARGVRGDSQDEPIGSVGYENVTNEKGERYVSIGVELWL